MAKHHVTVYLYRGGEQKHSVRNSRELRKLAARLDAGPPVCSIHVRNANNDPDIASIARDRNWSHIV